MENILKKLLPYFSLGLGVIILGFSAIFVRQADAPSVVLNLYRMGTAAVILTVPFLVQQRKNSTKLSRPGILFAVLGGAVFSLDLVFWSAGVQLGGPTNPTLMANTAPLWVGLGAALFLKEKRAALFWTGLLIALIGTFLILGLDLQASREAGLGTALGLIGSFFYGGYFLLTQRGRSYLNVLQYFWIAVVSASFLLALVAWIQGAPLLGYSRNTYLNLFALGVLVQGLGWFVLNFAQGYLPAAIVAPTLLGQPVITALLSHYLLGEHFTWGEAVSGAIVLLGVFLVHRSRQLHNRNGSPS